MKNVAIILLLSLLWACKPSVDKVQLKELPPLEPDYTNICIPVNIAPLNFSIKGARNIRVIICGNKQYRFVSRGQNFSFSLESWHNMLENEKGRNLEVSVFAIINGKDVGFEPFYWEVSPVKIDKYMSYRLIEPAYEIWNELSIVERDMESFKERNLAVNHITGRSCMNCHISNRASQPTSFFHLRGKNGGTLYSRGSQIMKINTATDSNSVAVYGAIDSTSRYGIFTTAQIIPILHSKPQSRLEVYDSESDLILLDFKEMKVRKPRAASGPEYQETFPCWSADMKRVYFARSPYKAQPDSTFVMRYNLYSLEFDPSTGSFADSVNLVFDAEAIGKSVSFPTTSPDGKFLVFCLSDYGTFPIWHTETDLWLLNLQTGEIGPLSSANSPLSDTYHSWSSNSGWICFASKRQDGVFGRPYIARIFDDGTASKAFILPQKRPDTYRNTFKSYNIPELYPQKESYSSRNIPEFYNSMPTLQMTFENNED